MKIFIYLIQNIIGRFGIVKEYKCTIIFSQQKMNYLAQVLKIYFF